MKALVVFEDPSRRDLVSFFLEAHFQMLVQGVASSREAIPLLKLEAGQLPFDILVCDYLKDAKALASHVLAQGTNIPFLCSAALLPNDPRVITKEKSLH